MANHYAGEIGECDTGLCGRCAFRTYKIVRSYPDYAGRSRYGYRAKTIRRGLSLAAVRAHCANPDACSMTTTKPLRNGERYFDSYYEE